MGNGKREKVIPIFIPLIIFILLLSSIPTTSKRSHTYYKGQLCYMCYLMSFRPFFISRFVPPHLSAAVADSVTVHWPVDWLQWPTHIFFCIINNEYICIYVVSIYFCLFSPHPPTLFLLLLHLLNPGSDPDPAWGFFLQGGFNQEQMKRKLITLCLLHHYIPLF